MNLKYDIRRYLDMNAAEHMCVNKQYTFMQVHNDDDTNSQFDSLNC